MKITYLPFQVTNDFPSPIVADFDTFLAQVEAPSAHLTKAKKWLNRATLFALNKEMKTFTVNESPKTDQIYYPLLDFFYHIGLAADFFRVVKVKSKYRLQPTGALTEYQQLNDVEKYFALFEAFWVYADWQEMLRDHIHISQYGIPEDDIFVTALSNLPCDETPPVEQILKNRELFQLTPTAHFIRFLSFFGLLTYTLKSLSAKEQYARGYIRLEFVTITPFGSRFLQILNNDRQFSSFNKPLRFNNGEESPGQEPTADQAQAEPFFIPFKEMLGSGNGLKKGLPVIKQENRTGTFIFKVSLDDVWRNIAISGRASLEDLHLAIQAAFDFNNDHLYSFSLDPQRLHPRKSYHSPYSEEAPSADLIQIGQMNLHEGQKLLYVFDYGDWWEFTVEVIEISDKPHFGDFKILEQEGENPEQYPDYDG